MIWRHHLKAWENDLIDLGLPLKLGEIDRFYDPIVKCFNPMELETFLKEKFSYDESKTLLDNLFELFPPYAAFAIYCIFSGNHYCTLTDKFRRLHISYTNGNHVYWDVDRNNLDFPFKGCGDKAISLLDYVDFFKRYEKFKKENLK